METNEYSPTRSEQIKARLEVSEMVKFLSSMHQAVQKTSEERGK